MSLSPGLLFLWTLFSVFTSTLAKEVSGIFTSINSISLYSGNGYPFDFYNVNVGWKITSSQNVQTGDTFTLNMPNVFEVRLTQSGSFRNNFDIVLSNGQHIASCNFDQAGGRASSTSINCQVTADISDYSTLSGSISFDAIFDGGGRIETTSAASRWTSGSNTITFNNNLSNTVSFSTPNTDTTQFLSRYTMKGDVFYYYLAPKNLCNGGAIQSGTFQFTVSQGPGGSFGVLNQSLTETYTTNNISPFGYPKSYSTLNGASSSYANNGRQLNTNFGYIPAGNRFWFSGFSAYSYVSGTYSVNYDLEVRCASGWTDSDYQTINLQIVQGDTGSNGSGAREYFFIFFYRTNSRSFVYTLKRICEVLILKNMIY